MEGSKIEWTTHTLNPWRGCTKVSAGCANCYAETFSGRNPKVLGVWGPNGTRVVAAESQWREPLKWNKEAEFAAELFRAAGGDASKAGSVQYKGRTLVYAGRPRVFCASLADVFEDWKGPMRAANGQELFVSHYPAAGPRWVPEEDCDGGEPPVRMRDVRARLFEMIDATPNLDWLLLTKRPENIAGMMPDYTQHTPGMRVTFRGFSVARPNVWLGTSVENQEAAEARIPHLLKVPAAVRFLSCEPLLGPVDVSPYLRCAECRGKTWDRIEGYEIPCPACEGDFRGVDWAIVGGESGPGARPMQVEWARDLVQQCKAAGVPVFVKQMGASAYEDRAGGDRLRVLFNDKKGGDPDEWPADLRVREFPEVKAGAA